MLVNINNAGEDGALLYSNMKFFLFFFCQRYFKKVINNGDPENHLDIVQLLVNYGVDLNAYDKYFKTALMSGKV
jgi:ankyrin repeat protein